MSNSKNNILSSNSDFGAQIIKFEKDIYYAKFMRNYITIKYVTFHLKHNIIPNLEEYDENKRSFKFFKE